LHGADCEGNLTKQIILKIKIQKNNQLNRVINILKNIKMYKVLIIIAVMIICKIDVKGQDEGIAIGDQIGKLAPGINYAYDAAGNRTSRKFLDVIGPIIIGDDPVVIKSAEIETGYEEVTLLPLEDCKIEVYPNPVKDELFVEIMNGDNKETYRLMIFDSTGKMVKENRRQGNGKEPIDMSMFPSGVYYLIISTKEGKLEFKIVVSQ